MKNSIYQSNKGFTLLEITATLMIIACISGLAGFSIVNYIDAFTLHKQHTEIAQEARLIISRLMNEFVHITEMREASETTIRFCSRFNNLEDTNIEYDKDNSNLKINGEIISDNISDFKLKYLTSVDAFENVNNNMWHNSWASGQQFTAIKFDISFEINPLLVLINDPDDPKKTPSYSITFTNITAVPRTLGALE